MVKRFLCIGLLLALAACEPSERAGGFVADNTKDSIYETYYKVEDWTMTPPKKKGENQAVSATYCYHAQTDVLCYRQPMPGWETRLVAYQGTDAFPPPVPVMELMPKPSKDTSQLAGNRIQAAKPVFKEKPKEEEEKAKDADGVPAVPNSQNEQLPDPSQSPQL